VNRIIICGCYDLARLLLMMNCYIPVSWYAIFVPAGTPRDVVAINTVAKRALGPV
jgi:hypothetical protein